MKFDAVLLNSHGRQGRDRKYWPGKTLSDYLDEAVASCPDKVAVVESRADGAPMVRMTYRELGATVNQLARALLEMGVERHDIVSVQLPNWWQTVPLTLACTRIGAVTNPLMPIFRDRELTYMLGFNEARVLVIPRIFRGYDYPAMIERIRPALPALRHVVVVEGDGEGSFEAMLAGGRAAEAAGHVYEPKPLDPDDVQLVKYTSGTTGEPKGVMHTSNTIAACMDGLWKRMSMDENEVILAASPVGHMTGYLVLAMMPLRLKGTTVLMDVWEPKRAMELIASEGVTFTAGSTPFLTDLYDVVAAGFPSPPSFRLFLCAGAPIPPVLIERAFKEMNLVVVSSYGATEAPGCTLTLPERAAEKSATSDGLPTAGWEIRIADPLGNPLPTGEAGRVLGRGPSLFGGYLKRPELNDTTEDGWFDTGDLAYMDDEGYIRVCGRTKDIIIRGGENVPVVEIENLLLRHPAVHEAAIVGCPHERLGERACAFVVVRPSMTFDLAEMKEYLGNCKVAKQYWPERIEVVNELPHTPTGKIQKFKLRETVLAFADSWS